MCNEGGEGGEWGLIDKIGKDEQIYIEIVYREREREVAISLWHVPSRNQKGEMIMRICLNVCTEREREVRVCMKVQHRFGMLAVN